MSNVYHVYPTNDEREHETGGDSCHCGPRIEEHENGKVVVHRSYDGREFVEQAAEIFKNPEAYLMTKTERWKARRKAYVNSTLTPQEQGKIGGTIGGLKSGRLRRNEVYTRTRFGTWRPRPVGKEGRRRIMIPMAGQPPPLLR